MTQALKVREAYSLHMQPGELWVVDFVLLHPEVCLGLPVIGLLILTEPRVGQGQEREIKACASAGQGGNVPGR